jgi:membrane glycosyltransferase
MLLGFEMGPVSNMDAIQHGIQHNRKLDIFLYIYTMLTLFGYSLLALALILFHGRKMSCMSQLILSLLTMVLLNVPTLLVMLFQT